MDYGEFVGAALLSQKQSLSSPSLLQAFHILDRDHDGFITQHDLSEVLGREVSENSGIAGKMNFEQAMLISHRLCTPPVHTSCSHVLLTPMACLEQFKQMMLKPNCSTISSACL